jgi:hypothetical protein
MDPLKISSVELDDRDPFRATFNVHLTRDMTEFERQTLLQVLTALGGCRFL